MRVTPLSDPDGYPLWPPLLASRGAGGQSQPHAHHAMHVVLAISGELECLTNGATVRAQGVLTAPDVVHQIDARGREVLLVFLDPESVAGAALARALDGPIRRISARERRALVEGASPVALMQNEGIAWAERAAAVLGAGALPPRRVHPRVRRALAHLRGDPSDQSLEALARFAGLSEGRFMHAFTESVGIPLRPYLAWLRLQRAAAAIAAGRSFTEAAHAAGFSDSAHLSRSFVRMFGMRPRDLRAAIRQPAGTSRAGRGPVRSSHELPDR